MNRDERKEWKELNIELQDILTELRHCNTNNLIYDNRRQIDYDVVWKKEILEEKLENIDTEIENFVRRHYSDNSF